MKHAGCHTRANVNMRDYTMPLEATDGHREILYWTHPNVKIPVATFDSGFLNRVSYARVAPGVSPSILFLFL